jgi:hypothetical protein
MTKRIIKLHLITLFSKIFHHYDKLNYLKIKKSLRYNYSYVGLNKWENIYNDSIYYISETILLFINNYKNIKYLFVTFKETY